MGFHVIWKADDIGDDIGREMSKEVREADQNSHSRDLGHVIIAPIFRDETLARGIVYLITSLMNHLCLNSGIYMSLIK